METEKILYEERILGLEKKLLQTIESLSECKKENQSFIHIASHDLQAPLRKLSTFIERLIHKLQGSPGSETLIYVEKINSTIADMRTMIDDLSALSGIDEAPENFIKCDLNKVIKGVISDHKTVLKENGAGINVSPLPVIDADPALLKKAFIAIIDNALKFKNKTEPLQLTITTAEVNNEEKIVLDLPTGKTYHKIEFVDNGIGFNQAAADKILKPFQRLHGKASYPGNGLGLAICKKIVDRHLGIIYARGNENEGARFVLILPETHN